MVLSLSTDRKVSLGGDNPAISPGGLVHGAGLFSEGFGLETASADALLRPSPKSWSRTSAHLLLGLPWDVPRVSHPQAVLAPGCPLQGQKGQGHFSGLLCTPRPQPGETSGTHRAGGAPHPLHGLGQLRGFSFVSSRCDGTEFGSETRGQAAVPSPHPHIPLAWTERGWKER